MGDKRQQGYGRLGRPRQGVRGIKGSLDLPLRSIAEVRRTDLKLATMESKEAIGNKSGERAIALVQLHLFESQGVVICTEGDNYKASVEKANNEIVHGLLLPVFRRGPLGGDADTQWRAEGSGESCI